MGERDHRLRPFGNGLPLEIGASPYSVTTNIMPLQGAVTTLPGVKFSTMRLRRIDRVVIHQLLGYCLLDHSDRFKLREVALYRARFAAAQRGPLDALLEQLAERPRHLQRVRDEFATTVAAAYGPTPRVGATTIGRSPATPTTGRRQGGVLSLRAWVNPPPRALNCWVRDGAGSRARCHAPAVVPPVAGPRATRRRARTPPRRKLRSP